MERVHLSILLFISCELPCTWYFCCFYLFWLGCQILNSPPAIEDGQVRMNQPLITLLQNYFRSRLFTQLTEHANCWMWYLNLCGRCVIVQTWTSELEANSRVETQTCKSGHFDCEWGVKNTVERNSARLHDEWVLKVKQITASDFQLDRHLLQFCRILKKIRVVGSTYFAHWRESYCQSAEKFVYHSAQDWLLRKLTFFVSDLIALKQ